MSKERKYAIVGGIAYLIIFVTGIFANFIVLEGLIVQDDLANTFQSVSNHIGDLKVGILAFVAMVIFDVVVAWVLYYLLKSVNRELSLMSALFRMVNAAVFGVALVHLFDVLSLVNGVSGLAPASNEALNNEVLLSLSSFTNTWLIGLIFFGVHLLILGMIIVKARFVKKFIGYLLLFAGVGYLIDSCAQIMMGNYADYQDLFATIVILPGVVGELSLTIWLLLRGGKQAE